MSHDVGVRVPFLAFENTKALVLTVQGLVVLSCRDLVLAASVYFSLMLSTSMLGPLMWMPKPPPSSLPLTWTF